MHLAIIHFNPIEKYPPVMNWLKFLAATLPTGDRVSVFTRDHPASSFRFESPAATIGIARYSDGRSRNALGRYASYFHFYAAVTRRLAVEKPDTVLYYETLSALPALFYRFALRRNTRLFVHYHEYTSPAEYEASMVLNAWAQRLERKRYAGFAGISQTNADRLRLFRADHPGVAMPALAIWANYPPRHWAGGSRPVIPGFPVKFVYIGALDGDTMYVREFAEWIRQQGSAASWDIYSWNSPPALTEYLNSGGHEGVRLHAGVSYFDLPEILRRFAVGVILYKGHIPNYVFNAPNKLFEYWSCGLDVWFPDHLSGAVPYITTRSFPRIRALNFANLEGINPVADTDRTGLSPAPCPFNAETESGAYLAWVQSRPVPQSGKSSML